VNLRHAVSRSRLRGNNGKWRQPNSGWYTAGMSVAVCVLPHRPRSALPINAFSCFLGVDRRAARPCLFTLQIGIGACGLGCARLLTQSPVSLPTDIQRRGLFAKSGQVE